MPIYKLLNNEIESSVNEGIISTISVFKGSAPIEQLEQRILKIINLNPWIGARLINGEEGELVFITPETIDSFLTYFEVFDIERLISGEKSILNLINIIEKGLNQEVIDKLYVSPIQECIERNTPLIKFSLVQDIPNNEFAIIFSMSHVMGDGESYYNIINMLSFNEDINKLNFERNTKFSRMLLESQENTNEKNKKTFIKTINLDLVKRVKNEINSSLKNSWISTHDVISSMYFNSVNNYYSIYLVNARPHLEYLSKADVGNYTSFLVFISGKDLKSQNIRMAIEKYKKGPENHENWINFIDQPKGEKTVALLTSWVQNYKQLNLGQSTSYISHQPLNAPSHQPESGRNVDNIAILYCSDAATWKLLCFSTQSEWLKDNPLFLE
ncbi:hypothetical protein [Vibrio sagamiensis]|uniref:Condensation domain-containing protein n=1 Tax=Vibrio sagamiensis NBRC 104589 TaxID=1219064 RepID=A0A511QCG3_9VIBR|nr:hypothetical protein [Vibrio sagamiensis]GEM74102.1 hypothetical protein VSA01S_02140 [Vibrio sagamiensis NBRC 104589]